MRVSRSPLRGRRGWSAVVGLSTALTVLVAGQLPAAGEPLVPAGGLPSPTAPAPELLAAVPLPAPVAWTSAGDRLPGPIRANVVGTPAPAAAPAAAPRARVATPAAASPALCGGAGWQQRRGQAALASLGAGAARTGFRVVFAGARKGYLGLTHLDERRIEVFVRPCGTQSHELLRHVVAHELGHAYDTTHLTSATRRAWMAARGIPAGTDWYGCSGCTDFATPAGDFAEVYAQWLRGAPSNRSELAGDVGAARLAQLAAQFFGA